MPLILVRRICLTIKTSLVGKAMDCAHRAGLFQELEQYLGSKKRGMRALQTAIPSHGLGDLL